jgi:hypothetical protein
MWHGKRAQRHGVDERVDRGRRADAERDGTNGDDGENRRTAQRAERVSDVAGRRINPRKKIRFPRVLADEAAIAKAAASTPASNLQPGRRKGSRPPRNKEAAGTTRARPSGIKANTKAISRP